MSDICEICFENPLHPECNCCFNCAKHNTDCDTWHKCGENCPDWEELRNCTTCKYDGDNYDEKICYECNRKYVFLEFANWQPKEEFIEKETNGDRIRNMTDRELVEIIMCPYFGDETDLCTKKSDCYDCVLDWLQSEVKD